ncbi:MAG: exonuclease domain-containing protein [Oscillospiraceae bacterium]|nr:exonuclease domain-containing protein [Oscillospiraceae bacterium]
MYQQHIVLDFEMNPVSEQEREVKRYLAREIIEIGAVRLDANAEVTDRFQCYVKPQFNDRITQTIRELTGIGYAQTNSAESFSEAMGLFAAWIGTERTRVYSWSMSDLYQLEDECDYKEIDIPESMYRWVDLQAIFPRFLRQKSYRRLALQNAAKVCGIEVDRTKVHGALYDAEVTARLLQLILDGSYRKLVQFQNEAICKEVSHTTQSLAQASGGALQQLLEKLRAEEA